MQWFVTGGSGFLGRRLIGTLAKRGDRVVALARSDEAARAVVEAGAEVARGDLDSLPDLGSCDAVVHAAAYVKELGPMSEFERVNVEGTRHVMKAAGPRIVVHVSTEAVLADGRPLIRVDETQPIPDKPLGAYAITKAAAERVVREANGIIVRPRFIWGADDTSLLPQLVEAVKTKRWAWFGDGRYLTSTCHVQNVCEGIVCAAEKGKPGETYFLTDGEPVEFRAFLTELFATQGVDPGTRQVPRWLAKALAFSLAWMKRPPVAKSALALISHEMTVVDTKARRELGYTGAMTRARGLEEMRASAAARGTTAT